MDPRRSLIAHLAPGTFFKLRFVVVEEVALLGIALVDGLRGKVEVGQIFATIQMHHANGGNDIGLFSSHHLILYYYLLLYYFLPIDDINSASGMLNAATLQIENHIWLLGWLLGINTVDGGGYGLSRIEIDDKRLGSTHKRLVYFQSCSMGF